MKHWKMKNEKFLFDIQTKCGDIANEILNASIDAERTFKCKWPNILIKFLTLRAFEIFYFTPGKLGRYDVA